MPSLDETERTILEPLPAGVKIMIIGGISGSGNGALGYAARSGLIGNGYAVAQINVSSHLTVPVTNCDIYKSHSDDRGLVTLVC